MPFFTANCLAALMAADLVALVASNEYFKRAVLVNPWTFWPRN